MSLDHFVSLFSAAISFVGLLFVAVQMRAANRQRKLESQIRLYDINRELISMGFDKPELFDVLVDKHEVNPVTERRYLQLWLNQLALVNSFKLQGAFQPDVQESFETDFRDIMTMSNMHRHWRKYGKYYPASFQQMVNDTLKKSEPPKAAAHVKAD